MKINGRVSIALRLTVVRPPKRTEQKLEHCWVGLILHHLKEADVSRWSP